jgi:hypothetical protein
MTLRSSVVSTALLMTLTTPAVSATAVEQQPAAPLAVGDVFPLLTSDDLAGRKVLLPDAARGRVALLMLGFTYDSRWAVEKWAKEFQSVFGGQPDVTFFEVPVIGGMGRLAKWFIDSGMRKGTPKELHGNVMTVYGGGDRLKALMGFRKSAENDAYLALLDQTGRVAWLHHGAFAASDFDRLRAEITALLTK